MSASEHANDDSKSEVDASRAGKGGDNTSDKGAETQEVQPPDVSNGVGYEEQKEVSGELTNDGETESVESDTVTVVDKRNMLKPSDRAIIEDDSLGVPIPLLPGEMLRRLGRSSTGDVIMLTTYRLFITYSNSFANVSLGLIESVECMDVAGIQANCKDGTVRRFVLASSDIAFKWLHAIKQEKGHVQSFADYFAVAFHVTSQTENTAPWDMHQNSPFKLGRELKRLGFDMKKKWRITNANDNYEYCETYPKENVVPKAFTDESLQAAAVFRTKNRFPSAVWRHRESGMVLLRCSQPSVGLFYQRNQSDEDFIQAIIDCCEGSDKMLIADARAYTSAVGNRAKGGGFEYSEYYANCDIEFMNLPNIHSVRASFTSVRSLVCDTNSSTSWHSSLHSTCWLTYLSTLLSASAHVAKALATKPVLVHCSDGWDRTAQMVSLAQLILDPHYRTFKGFQELIDREWLHFGHKFADRCGNGKSDSVDAHEYSPIFLQWLDAVYQLTRQFPTAFEFDEQYLIKLVQHCYSRMFGTFLFNNMKGRDAEVVYCDTASVWSLLDAMRPRLSNKLYTPGVHKVLEVSSHTRDLQLWASVFASQTSHTSSSQEEVQGLRRSRSYTEISLSTESNLHLCRRLSETDLTSSINLGDEHTTSTGAIAIPSEPVTSTSSTELIAASFSSSPIVKLSLEQRSRNNSGTSMKELSAASLRSKRPTPAVDYTKYLDMDGLTPVTLPERQRLDEITGRYEREIERLKKQISDMQKDSTCHSCAHPDNQNGRDGMPGSAGSNSDQSDESWEDVSTRESTVILWIPDHAVAYCCSCAAPFKVYRRRHHCRQCGLVFCMNCAGMFVDLPEQQLYEPVRVCNDCYKKRVEMRGQDYEDEEGILGDMVVSSNSSNGDRNGNGHSRASDIAKVSGGNGNSSNRSGPDSEQWAHNSANMKSSPYGSPIKAALRDSLSGGKTCSQESLSNDSNTDTALLMDAKAS